MFSSFVNKELSSSTILAEPLASFWDKIPTGFIQTIKCSSSNKISINYIFHFFFPSSKVIYISSDTDLQWADRDFQLQSVYINGENGIGTIPAGTKVAVAFSFEPHTETNERGTIDFYLDVVAEY